MFCGISESAAVGFFGSHFSREQELFHDWPFIPEQDTFSVPTV
jgi:hypothetical protein